MSEQQTQKTIFVFGSNLAGRHGRGSAREALERWGAQYGIGEGRTGDAYAIPTKGRQLEVLPLSAIALSIIRFLEYARAQPELHFRIVAIGCGLAGYKPAQIAPFFANAPKNCELPIEFKRLLETLHD